MKQVVLSALVFGVVGMLTSAVSAQPTEKIAPPAVPAQQFCERTYTCYKPVAVEREIKQVICKLVPREEKYTCTVYVPVWKDVKRTETYCVPVQKEVVYTCNVMVPVTTQEKRTVRECSMIQKEVDYKCTVMVPRTVQEKRVVCYPEIQRKLIEEVVPVCKLVRVECTDACGNCYTTCQRVMENQKVTREVCVPILKTKEVMVNVVVCEPQVRIAKKIVCQPVYTDKVVLVNVTKCVAEARTVKGTVCEMVPKTREVVCKVMSCVPEQRTGSRTVYSTVQETVTRKVMCTEMVPFTQVERIPIICGGCSDYCASPSLVLPLIR